MSFKIKQYQKRLIMLLFIVLPCTISSQITIGELEEPHPSAVLELKTTDKGLLAPNVALSDIWDKKTVPNYTDGLLVYNTADSDTEIAVGDRVKAGKFYYWSKDRWIQVVGRQTMIENMEQALANLGIPRPAIFTLNGNQKLFCYDPFNAGWVLYHNMLGVINPLEGVFPDSQPNYAYLPMKERVNYTSGTVKLDSAIVRINNVNKKKFFITFQPGIYSLIFTYEFIPADTAGSQYKPGHDECYSATYFMQFPVNIVNPDKTITTGLTRVESNCYHGPGYRINREGRYADHGNTISYVAVLLKETVWDIALGTGHGDTNCNGKAGLSMPNRSTFLYVSRLGDAN
ncbi:MAG: hypothetical protein E6767_11085 [Dysgonomonas sp.]|nr:hypothetical protein [Dysgonomonas sp.]